MAFNEIIDDLDQSESIKKEQRDTLKKLNEELKQEIAKRK